MRSGRIHLATALAAGLCASTAAAHASDSRAVIPHGGWAYPRQLTPASAWGAPPPPTVPVPPAYLGQGSSLPHDPMAPRPDAPVYRVQPSADSGATASGPRYYSVHRQVGRQPDAPPRPAPVYLDALPVDLSEPPASDDLAAPPATPQMIRDANGRLRAVADYQDPS